MFDALNHCATATSKDMERNIKMMCLKYCDLRDDNLARIVKARVLGPLSDLHAADACYHNKCIKTFFDTRPFSRSKGKTRTSDHGHSFYYVCNETFEDRSKYWSSVDLFNLYEGIGGPILSRKVLFSKILNYLVIKSSSSLLLGLLR